LPRGPYTNKSLAGIRAAFLAEYKRIFQQVPPVGAIEIINIRVALTAPIGRAALKVEGGKGATSKALKGRRKAWLADRARYAEMPVYDRYLLPVGGSIRGPAIIEEASATMVVPPGARARVDRAGNLLVDLTTKGSGNG
jgi:N-methylhydantoinase A